jgi:hypothetical protein
MQTQALWSVGLTRHAANGARNVAHCAYWLQNPQCRGLVRGYCGAQSHNDRMRLRCLHHTTGLKAVGGQQLSQTALCAIPTRVDCSCKSAKSCLHVHLQEMMREPCTQAALMVNGGVHLCQPLAWDAIWTVWLQAMPKSVAVSHGDASSRPGQARRLLHAMNSMVPNKHQVCDTS